VADKPERPPKRGKKTPADPKPERTIADHFTRVVAPPDLYDDKKREEWKLDGKKGRGPYIVELNLQHIGGLSGAETLFRKHVAEMREKDPELPDPDRIAKTYFRIEMRPDEWQQLLAKDERWALDEADKASKAEDKNKPAATDPTQHRSIYKLWPDFPIKSHIDRSMATVKADAALKSFDASGQGITWAVIDSGINGGHRHFEKHSTLTAPLVNDLHRCFAEINELRDGIPFARRLQDPDAPEMMKDDEARKARIDEHRHWALLDDFGHGTHVAGIIAGEAPDAKDVDVIALERVDKVDAGSGKLLSGQYQRRKQMMRERLRGAAPAARLISLRVLDEKGDGRSSDVIRALEYIREHLNDNPKLMRVQGVNLSVGYEFDAEMFACGQSPICSEVNRLVQSGVVVVAAAGNTGYGTIAAAQRATKVGLSNTINDPGNADMAITVGATHRDSPHTFGVSYFSSKGPTGDGRLKPDLVAPGERITSCAAGKREEDARSAIGDAAKDAVLYIEDSGTSMAAPHVSGAIAAFLSIRQEFIGRPLEVKRIFLEAATPLGRERYFEGRGLLDLMRAIQSV
jgi:subtilisin family serine protease